MEAGKKDWKSSLRTFRLSAVNKRLPLLLKTINSTCLSEAASHRVVLRQVTSYCICDNFHQLLLRSILLCVNGWMENQPGSSLPGRKLSFGQNLERIHHG